MAECLDTFSLEIGKPERTRWYILFITFLVYTFQSNDWFTFSSIPNEVEDYYDLSKPGNNKVNGVIDLLLNWGPIAFLPVTPFSAYLLSYPIIGFKYTVRIAITLVFLGAFIRCIPSFLVSLNIANYTINNNFWNTLIFLHIGQILNDIAGPLVMSPPPKLSAIWFPANQRALATGIGVSAGVFGTCLGFLIGPIIHYVDKLLYFDLILCLIPFICVWIYFPKYPSKLPNEAAKNALLSTSMSKINRNSVDIKEKLITNSPNIQDIDNIDNNKSDKENKKNGPSFKEHFGYFLHELYELILNRSAMILVVVGGFTSGAFSGWSGVFQDMLSPLGLNDTDIGVIGFNFNLNLFVGSIVFGLIADKCFHKKLKLFIIIGWTLGAFILGILLFILPSPFSQQSLFIINKNSDHLYKNVILNILIGIAGFVLGGLAPLHYELLAEVSYPVTEGTSSTLLVFMNNISCLVFVGIGNWINTTWETLLTLILVILSLISIFFVKEEYKRM